MSYPKKLLRLRPRRGAASDLPSWSNGPDTFDQADNIIFRQGVAERAPVPAPGFLDALQPSMTRRALRLIT